MNKTTKNMSKNHALPVGSQGDSEIYGARKNPIAAHYDGLRRPD
jgi:hypothetical protein